MGDKKDINYIKTTINLFISLVTTFLVVYFGIRLFFFFTPFVVGWVIAMIASPVVKWLEKRLKIVRKLGTAIIIIVVLGAIIFLGYFGISQLWGAISDLANNLPEYVDTANQQILVISQKLGDTFSFIPNDVDDIWGNVVENLDVYIASFLDTISEPTVSAAGNIAKKIPSALVAVVVCIVSSYFFVAERDTILEWVKKVTPKAIQMRMELVNSNFKRAIGGYFKAQFKIMLIIGIFLILAFLFLGIKYAVLIGILIAILDFLPLFGTGTAMIPWAIAMFLLGDYRLGIYLLVLYVLTLGIHQLLQPKLVADSIGIHPILTLFLLYIGYRFGGIMGMIITIPIGLILINLYKAKAFDYILDDVKILLHGIMKLRGK